MSALRSVLVVVVLLALGPVPACTRRAATRPASPVAPEPGAASVAVGASPEAPGAADAAVAATSSSPVPQPKAAAVPPPPPGDENAAEDLVQEEHERDPRSQTVKILIEAEPVRAKVFWGIKCLGATPLELERPRQSGPLDVTLEAPGFLRYHTRLFTDRDDKLKVHLVPAAAGARVLGYRAPEQKNEQKRSK